MTSSTITILLPVYGRSELLEQALESVLALNNQEWQLLIADDGSDALTQSFLSQWLVDHDDPRVRWVKRPTNLGLFANLNQAIKEAGTEWVLLLCSDDVLNTTALEQLNAVQNNWPEAELILSTFQSINADGSERPADSAWHHDQISKQTALIKPDQMLPALLRLGSVNGNLTGMAFTRTLWQKAGPFREAWRHAADWEWLIRATSEAALVLNRIPIAKVRTHNSQLSNSNRQSGHELTEVATVVKALMAHPHLANEPKRWEWGSHVMQFQLWNVLKGLGHRPVRKSLDGLLTIHNSTGLRQTVMALARWLPTRWRRLQSTSAL